MTMTKVAVEPSVSTTDDAVFRRLRVLQLADRLGNVSEACRRSGMDRTSFYDWKQRYAKKGLAGLRDLPPVHRSHPQATPDALAARIFELSLQNPGLGCNKLEKMVANEGQRVSAITIQKILNARALGTKRQRWLALDTAGRLRSSGYTATQLAFLENQNPAVRERDQLPTRPGAQLVADTMLVATLSGRQRVYLHAIVDCFGALAFGGIGISKQPVSAITVLRDAALPFYRGLGLQIETVVTDQGREFCGSRDHPYGRFLIGSGLTHRRLPASAAQSHGIMARFQATVLHEFVSERLGAPECATIDKVQSLFRDWLKDYNLHRPNLGFANFGRTPSEMLRAYAHSRRRD